MKRVLLLLVVVMAIQLSAVAQYAQWIVEPIYDEIGEHTEDVTAVKRGGKWGYLNSDGEEFVKCEFDKIYPFVDGVSIATTEDNQLQAIIHEDGYVVDKFRNNNGGKVDLKIDPRFPYFGDDMLLVTDDTDGRIQDVLVYKQWGYLNKNGILSIPIVHFLALPFSEGKARVVDNKMQYYYIKNDGSTAISNNSGLKTAKATFGFSNGVALVCDRYKLYFIDSNGRKVDTAADVVLKDMDPTTLFFEDDKNAVVCGGDRIQIDSFGRAASITRGADVYNLTSEQQSVKESVTGLSGFTFNDQQVKDELRWLSPELAVLSYEGKLGVVKVQQSPIIEIELNGGSVNSIFGNIEPIAYTVGNNSGKELTDLTVEVNGEIKELKSIPVSGIKSTMSVEKPSDAERDVIEQGVKVTQHGVLILEKSVEVEIVDEPALFIKGSGDYFHNKSNNTFSMSVNIENSSSYPLEGATLTINDSHHSVSIAPHSEQNCFTIFGLDSNAETIDVVISITHPKAPVITRKGTLVLENINQ